MSISHYLSRREKILAVVAGVLLLATVGVGYAQSSAGGANVLVAQDDSINQQNQIKDRQRWFKDLRREISDVKKIAPNFEPNAVEALINKNETCVNALSSQVGTPEFWNLWNDCDATRRDIDDAMNGVRVQRDCGQYARNIADRKKEKKNLDQQLKDILRNNKNADVSALNKVFDQINASFAKADAVSASAGACTETSRDVLNDVQSELNGLFQDGYSAANEINQAANVVRQCEDNKRMISDRKKEKKNNIDRQIKDILRQDKNADVSALNAIVAKMDDDFAKADQLASGVCTDETSSAFSDIRSDLDQVFQDFYSSTNAVQETANQGRRLKDNQNDFDKNKKRQCEKDMAKEFKNFDREMTKAKKATGGELPGDAQESYDKVRAVYDQLCGETGLLGAMKTALDNKDADAFDDARSQFDNSNRDFWDSMNETRQMIQELAQRAEQLKQATKELTRWTKELGKMKKDVERMKKQYNRTARKYAGKDERKEALLAFQDYINQTADLIAKIEDGVAQAKEEAPKDPDAWWMDGRQDDLQELQQEFYDMQQKVQMISQVLQTLKDAENEISGQQLTRELAQLKAESGDDPELMGALNDLLAKAKENLKSAWNLAIADPEGAMEILKDMQALRQEWDQTIQDWRGQGQDSGTSQSESTSTKPTLAD